MQVSNFAPADTLSAAHPLWAPLVKPLLPPAEAVSGNWLTGAKAAAAPAGPTSISVLGEWIYVEARHAARTPRPRPSGALSAAFALRVCPKPRRRSQTAKRRAHAHAHEHAHACPDAPCPRRGLR
eukprot:6659113-Prymnesium_polylepis.1